MSRRVLLIEKPIEADQLTCGDCTHRTEDYCALFGFYLKRVAPSDWWHRVTECLDAECRASDRERKEER